MCPAYHSKRITDAGTGTEAERGGDLFDCGIGLAGPTSEGAANVPAASEARVERDRSISQPNHCVDVLAEIGESNGSISKHIWIVATDLEGPACEIGALPAVRVGVLARAIKAKAETAVRGPGERGPVMRIARDCLLHQTQRLGDLPCRRPDHRIGAQIEVVGGQIGGWRLADRAVSAACKAGSITPATLDATLS